MLCIKNCLAALANMLSDMTIRVGVTATSMPYIFDCGRQNARVRADCPLPGLAIEIVDFCLGRLGWPYKLISLDSADGDFGEPLDNGSWTGEMVDGDWLDTSFVQDIWANCKVIKLI